MNNDQWQQTPPHQAYAVHYHLDFERYHQHLVTVQMTFTANDDEPLLWMPSWIAGSYLMREFARNITAVHYTNQLEDDSDFDDGFDDSSFDDSELESSASQTEATCTNQAEDIWQRAIKISKNEWKLIGIKAKDSVCVTYEVYCFDLSVRTAYVDQYRIYGNFTSLALTVEGLKACPVNVTLSVPSQFYHLKHAPNTDNSSVSSHLQSSHSASIVLACGLKHTHFYTEQAHYYHLQAGSYEQLIDFPFEISKQAQGAFVVHDDKQTAIAHRVFISGKHHTDMARLQQDLAKICQTYLNWLGDAPFAVDNGKNSQTMADGYTFMTYASGNDYGGLEHINSTSLITPRNDLPNKHEPKQPQSAYQRYLGLCSHEYFHAWWVKTVRPDVMITPDFRHEVYTPLLWVFEGFTSYIDDFMLQASGVISPVAYLKLLTEQINRYTQTHGRHLQSVAESSFDAWIKLYRSDENTGNAGISYYNKGALVALCLDLMLLTHSDGKYRLFDVVKAFYQQAKQTDNNRIGMSDASLTKVISQFIDADVWADFASRYVNGVEELPIAKLLADNGVTIINEATDNKDNTLPWGIRVEEVPEGLKVAKVLRDGVATQAGLSAKDVIVAIDGIKASKNHLQQVAQYADGEITCHAFRRDELIVLTIPAKVKDSQQNSNNPSLDKIKLQLNESGWQAWLNVFTK